MRGPKLAWFPYVVGMLLLAVGTRADDTSWAGLDILRDLGERLGHPLRGGERVDLGVVSPRDGVLLIGPSAELPVAGLSNFLDAGGRLAVLDDFGTARALLSAYQIQRSSAPSDEAVRLRDNPDLLIALPSTEHPLARDVDALLTNRAVTLRHSLLKPVYTYARTDDALVLAGAVGAGRLVAVGDASLLIDQQLALPGQREFARNLLEYLSTGGGELWLVGPDQELFGTFGRPHRPGVQRVDTALGKLSHPDLPMWMVMALAAAGVVAVAVWMLGSLPKVTPYLTPDGLPAPRVWAGFAGRVAVAQRDGHSLFWAALDYRAELIADCARALAVDEPPDRHILLDAAERAGRPARERETLAALLSELDALSDAEARPDELPRVAPEQLSRMVTTGERLVQGLEMKPV